MDLAVIRAKAKQFIGDSGYDNVALDLVINRMYQRVLPLEFSLEALKTEFTVTTTDGIDTYAVDSDTYLTIREPVYLNGVPIHLYRNKGDFYNAHPKNPLHTITGVNMGTSDIVGSTGAIDYTYFDVAADGDVDCVDLDASGNVVVTGNFDVSGVSTFSTGTWTADNVVAIFPMLSINGSVVPPRDAEIVNVVEFIIVLIK